MLKRYFLAECKEDYVELWSLVKMARRELIASDDDQIKNAVIETITPLLVNELIVAGNQSDDGGFVPTKMSVTEICEYILKQWSILDRDPGLGEIISFTSTPKGDLEDLSE